MQCECCGKSDAITVYLWECMYINLCVDCLDYIETVIAEHPEDIHFTEHLFRCNAALSIGDERIAATSMWHIKEHRDVRRKIITNWLKERRRTTERK